MSESIRRRSSSRQLLQNLIRVTAQRSQEDAEEVERERRRRARERQREEPEVSHHDDLTHSTGSDVELKPSCCLVLEEDEGFSDWTHRLENRNGPEVRCDAAAAPQWKPGPEEEEEKEEEEEEEDEARSCWSHEASVRPPEKTPGSKKRVGTSFSSSVFMPQDARLQQACGHPADRVSYLAAGTMKTMKTMKTRGGACGADGEVEPQEEEEVWRSAGSRQSCSDEEDQEEEELRFTREDMEDVHLMGGPRHREEEEEHKMPDKRLEGNRDVEMNSRPAASLCSSSSSSSSSSESEEPVTCYGPMSPTFKKLLIQFYPEEINSRVCADNKCTIVERTESLRRSTSSIKKMLPPAPVSKIDKKLEQYTHALELSSKEGRSGGPVLTDLTGTSEAVASKKNLFEAKDAWNQSPASVTASKDADAASVRVGVADLISQWVRGGDDGSRCSSPSKPAEIKPGGVLNKKNLWESLSDTVSPGRDGKEASPGKKYKFVVTGHGKYEKVPVDNSSMEYRTCPSGAEFDEDL